MNSVLPDSYQVPDLLELGLPDPRDLNYVLRFEERTVGLPPFNDLLGQAGTDSGQGLEFSVSGGIEVDEFPSDPGKSRDGGWYHRR